MKIKHKLKNGALIHEVGSAEIKGVIPFRETPKAPEGEKWNGPREVREAEVKDLKIMCCWFDSENPDIKGSYKLPHHQAKGHKAVWRGIAASMAMLFGARGGVDVPSGDRKGIYNHLAKEYKKFDKEPPEFKEYTTDELRILFRDIIIDEAKEEFEKRLDEDGTARVTKELWNDLLEQIRELQTGIVELKEGRVLSSKNRKLIQACIDQMHKAMDLLEALIQATEPPKEEQIDIDIEVDKTADDKTARVDNTTAKDKLDIDTDKLTPIIQEALKNNIDRISKMIEDRIAKLQGKVE